MPKIGTLKRGREIGRDRRRIFIWALCEECGKERWVRTVRGQPRSKLCHHCGGVRVGLSVMRRGQENPHWKGGAKCGNGYIYILKPEHPRANSNGYVKQAILVLEEKLRRPLAKGMLSHHKNEIKDDDRPENLEEQTRAEHSRNHILWKQFIDLEDLCKNIAY